MRLSSAYMEEKRRMKRNLITIVVMVVLFSLAGCSGNKNQETQVSEQAEEKDATVVEETTKQSEEVDNSQDSSANEIPEDVQKMYDKSMEVLDLMYDLELGTNKNAIVDMALLKVDLESCYNALKEGGGDKKAAIDAQKIYLSASKWTDVAVNYSAHSASIDELSAEREEFERAIDEYVKSTGIVPGNNSSSKAEEQVGEGTMNANESKSVVTSSDIETESVNKTDGPKVVLYRDNSFIEANKSADFSGLQPYLNYMGSVANLGQFYIRDDLMQNIENVSFLDVSGTFSYKVSGTIEIGSDDKTAEFVRIGQWNSNDSIDGDKFNEMLDAMTQVYGDCEVDYSDGSVSKSVDSKQNYNNYHYSASWEDVGHYDYIYLSYYTDNRIGVMWIVGPASLLGYEPIMGVNEALSDLQMIESPLLSTSYVDISDCLTGDVASVESAKCYIYKFVYENKEGEPVPLYKNVIVILDTKRGIYESYLNDMSDEDMESLYSNREEKNINPEDMFLVSDREGTEIYKAE